MVKLVKEISEYIQVTSHHAEEGFTITHKPTGTSILPVHFLKLEEATKVAEELIKEPWDWSKSSKEEIVGGVQNLEQFYSKVSEILKNTPHVAG